MILTHDINKEDYRRPFGAAVCGSRVTLALDAAGAGRGASCSLVLWPDGEEARLLPMEREQRGSDARFAAQLQIPDEPGLLFYRFLLTTPLGEVHVAPDSRGAAAPAEEGAPGWQITVYRDSPVPDWYRNAVAYQIFPDRFRRGADWRDRWEAGQTKRKGFKGPGRVLVPEWDTQPWYIRAGDGSVACWNFWGGTARGILEKLDYLKSLGVTLLYLNPIFEAATNHRYDTADYFAVDPVFGTEEDLRALLQAAKERGIRVMLDGVFNHTGADSRYFDAYGNYGGGAVSAGEKSPYWSWYSFTRFPDEYDAWWGVKDLPAVREMDPGFIETVCGENGVIRRWIRLGVKGWRLDVADELPDAFIRLIRAAAKAEDPEAVVIGEVWEDASNKIAYGERRAYFAGDELDGVMNYPLRTAVLDLLLGRLDAPGFKAALDLLKSNYPAENFAGSLSLLGSHDRERLLTVLGGAPELPDEARRSYRLPQEALRLGLERERLAALLQFALPGVPCVYYGDEAGMQGFSDPYNRGPYPWGGENRALVAFYRALGRLRREHAVLRTGSWELYAPAEDVLCVARRLDRECMVLLLNRSDRHAETVRVPAGREAVLLLDGRRPTPARLGLEEAPQPADVDPAFALPVGDTVLQPEGGRIRVRLEPLSAALLWFKG